MAERAPVPKTLGEIALRVDDLEGMARFYRQTLGLEVETTEHPWVQWRSLYFRDPEGNLVELVCFDPEIPWQGG